MRYAGCVGGWLFLAWALMAAPIRAADGPPPLPVPHANNAVAAVTVAGRTYVMSATGLMPGKTHADTSRALYIHEQGAPGWRRLPPLPVKQGRLAATAQAAAGTFYLFGGYSVAPDGSEVSTPEVFAIEPLSGKVTRRADMPLPVDDTVSFTYRDRFIYLVSGWHDDGNVAAVQVYDTRTDTWQRATDYPGTPVFGHAGGAAGGRIVIADGVAVLGEKEGRRTFGLVGEVWLGTIAPGDATRIDWRKGPPHPGAPLYRMAAARHPDAAMVIFAGGSPNSYNFDGIGYDGAPSPASDRVMAFDFNAMAWRKMPSKPIASMDHRGLISLGGRLWTIGGMLSGQTVTGRVLPLGGR
ncbi:Kelch repeat-containing protein [Yunchengibacter salinarum]|uniref:Kelch repeat-containing protein n=1 Tax=Yunchengibacter salinarum TaxID=3133399 RepID=UPI0035B58692